LIPREELPSGKIMIRPLLRFNEIEIEKYLANKEIPYINTPCIAGNYKFKRRYFTALDIFKGIIPGYDKVIDMLSRHKIFLNEMPYDEMVEDNFFIDC
jgi:tRNA(Ile)-lysidine synthase TilS/MesJ